MENQLTLMENFEETAKLKASNIALLSENYSLTYSQLNVRINQLAHKLLELGVEPGDRIGLIMNRGPKMIITIYAILKLKGSYVPIDPDFPSSRINYILDDSQPKLIISDEKVMYDTLIYEHLDQFSNFSSENPKPIQILNPIMYIIFTSGTTGDPKGVIIRENGVKNLIDWMKIKYNINDNDNILFKTPFTFDVSVWEILGWSSTGATLVLLPQKQQNNPEVIAECISKCNVTIISFVPSMLNAFVEYIKYSMKSDLLYSIRLIHSAGEELKVNHISSTYKVFKNALLINLYAPTETTVESIFYECPNNINSSRVPIGKPLPNINAYIMKDNELCDINEVGELYISGISLADGYLNLPNLTKEKFFFCDLIGERVYATGDLALWNGSNELEYLGRKDKQVKVRGYRIELSEIEKRLNDIEGIKSSIVVPSRRTDNPVLLAYFINDNKEVTILDIKKKLSENLPAYMIPSQFMEVDKIPTNNNGKLDVNQLPIIEKEERTRTTLPRNQIEQDIVNIYSTVLNTSSIDINDDFFDLGGTSLDAIKTISLLTNKINLSIKDIFELRTPKNIAEKVNKRNCNSLTDRLNSIKEHNYVYQNQLQLFKNNKFDHTEKSIDINKKELIIDNNHKNILLTGVTGHLGIHLLKSVLELTNYHIYLLVRAKDSMTTLERVEKKWKYYFKNNFSTLYQHRISFLEGDIASEHFGLGIEEYDAICNNVTIILNSAANVNYHLSYEEAYEANVESVKQILSFSNKGKIKTIHHISTMSVASGDLREISKIKFTEQDSKFLYEAPNVYVKTKREAEEILNQCREKNNNINIYRIGNLQSNYDSGICQKNIDQNAYMNTFKAFTKLNVYPNMQYNFEPDFTHVDQAAKACVKLMKVENLRHMNHHIYNNNFITLKELVESYNEYIGNNLSEVGFYEFLDNLNEKDYAGLGDFVNIILLNLGAFDEEIKPNLFLDISNQRTNKLLELLGFKWEPISQKKLNLMFSHLKKVSFLK